MNVKSVKIWILAVTQAVLIVSQSLQAQTTENCEVLNFILKNKEVQSAFFLNKETDESIVIADMTQHNWEQCKVNLGSGRKVYFQKDTLLTGRKDVLHIVLYDLKKYGQRYTAQLHQKETNAYVKIEIRKRRRSMKVVRVEISHF